MNSLLTKGNYKPINKNFLVEGHEVLEEVAKVQEKYNKSDTDTFINELRDSMAGHYLGYDLVNTNKHGFDCKLSVNQDIFLEVKSASFSASTWSATFNDKTIEKAQCFQNDKVYLCLAIWKNASNLLFVVYGKNPKIGQYLQEKVEKFLKGEVGVRSTQTISLSQLIFEYDFDIIYINKSKEEVKSILQLKSKHFFNIPDSKFLNLSEYNEKYSKLWK
ncbi:hypothetical protein [Mycoplasmopsis felifaucium]|uniref:hypothetical protein n=1 Tax=Mycoplasmopsis felifaucium TaxID=35768 RepID=UPI00068A9E28|nr:hypothetical protein [Mycoplasmopsis felifaucium]